MHTNATISIDLMYHIKEMLNNEIRNSGEIQINNKTIWDGFLHQMSNEDWLGIVMVLHELECVHPELFTPQHTRALEDCAELLHKFSPYYDRVMDMKNRHVSAKKTAWKMLMTVREIWNSAVGDGLPNLDSSRVKTNYGELFD